MDSVLDAAAPSVAFRESPLPGRAGVGLKAKHVEEIIETEADIGFFEVHAENYMGAGGAPHAQLSAIRERYPLSLHGVGMSIGSQGGIDPDHLARFKRLVEIYQPGMVSEHLAWSTHEGVFYNDLLPLPYDDETLARVVEHVEQVQEAVKRKILIENPSTYVRFAESTREEADFMAEIARRSGCGLLLDVNNVFVSAANQDFSPRDYLLAYPTEMVEEIHLAGHAPDSDDQGRELLIDAHDREVDGDVWELYRFALSLTGALPSLVEWDNDVPQWPVLLEEARRAESILESEFGSSPRSRSPRAA